jgi:hypothetical protein
MQYLVLANEQFDVKKWINILPVGLLPCFVLDLIKKIVSSVITVIPSRTPTDIDITREKREHLQQR